MPKMTGGPAKWIGAGMTTAGKDDIKHMTPKQRARYRREGFSWSDIKKIDQAIGKGEKSVTLASATRTVTITFR
ncbi:hypothetical protein ACFYNW_35010 [Streptomyces virginiae]|uniref:Uncharacterized protein n=1 Tax=Streptomyces subrutilus TaxID=36818 RepID=A0A1E5P0R8_9ACTN|nr:hypothetical protein [Streptomyces subrutilus]OEJ22601.1 hypothetical protein BGK67_34415 [Streptomyces subrutilus]